MATVDVAASATEEDCEELLDKFAQAALDEEVRVVGGDFGKALWCFGPGLEKKNLRADLAAWFPWVDDKGATRCLSGTVGVFVLGGCERVQQLHEVSSLTSQIGDTLTPGAPSPLSG